MQNHHQDQTYFAHARDEIMPHLPQSVARVMELGPGAGGTIAMIKQRHPNLWSYGIEISDDAADKARKVLNVVDVADVETHHFEDTIEPASLDVILCLDVLEHLRDPWSVVKRLSPLLRPGGRLIVSVPNIRNWKFIKRLLLKGDFFYTDAGLLDRTHLRFFVRPTAIELGTCGGLALLSAGSTRPPRFPEAKWWLSTLSGGALDDLTIKQFLIVCEAR